MSKRLTNAAFETEILKSDLPVVLYFYLPWYRRCKEFTPILEQIRKDFEGRVKFGKIDFECNVDWAIQFNVKIMPALLFFTAGKQVEFMEEPDELEIRKRLNSLLIN